MKTLFTLIFLCLYVVGHGQDPASTVKGWKLGFGISPDIAYRTLKDKGEPYSSNIIEQRNELERPRLGYSAGLYANYILNDRLGIGTGLIYSLKGYHVLRHKVEDRYKSQLPFEPHYRTSTYGSAFLEIPLTAIVTFGKGRLRSISSIGIACSLMMVSRSTSTAEYEDGRTHHWRSSYWHLFDQFDITGVISTGASFRTTSKLELRLEPHFRHSLFTYPASVYATTLFWNAGINFSAFIDLR